MKVFERIFLYSIIAILIFHVFLVDERVESQPSFSEEIRTKKITIVNNEGAGVIELYSYSAGGVILVKNKRDVESVTIGTAVGGGGNISVKKEDGTVVAIMGVTNIGGGKVSVKNEKGNEVAGMAPNTDGDGRIWINNRDSVEVSFVGTNVNGSGLIGTSNKDGVLGTILANTNNCGIIQTFNKNGHELVSISQTTEGHGGIWIYDRYGEYPTSYGPNL
jgi:translation initiation factor IF-1